MSSPHHSMSAHDACVGFASGLKHKQTGSSEREATEVLTCHAGLVNGAFYVKPRPFFFAHIIGIRAYMQGRSILMKAVGMWHWEVGILVCCSRL